jgi:hypothetical protein
MTAQQHQPTFAELALRRDLKFKRSVAHIVNNPGAGPHELHPDEVEELQSRGMIVDVGADSAAHPGRKWCAVRKGEQS